MTTQGQLDTLEDAVEAKANREYVMVRRETAEELHEYYLDEIIEQEAKRGHYAEGTDAHKKWSAFLADTRAKAKAVSDLLCKEPSGGR